MTEKNIPSLVYGLHAVHSLVKNHPERIQKLIVLKGRHDHRLQQVIDDSKGIDREYGKKEKLNELAQGGSHQGIIAQCGEAVSGGKSWSENQLMIAVENAGHAPLLLVLDGVTDPHNLGACLRTCDATGVMAVIVPKDKAVGMTAVVSKVACGAAETIPLVQVTNLSRTLRSLQQAGVWIIGMSGDATQSLYQTRLTGPMAMVMGAEGKGIRRLTQEHCDELIFIPMAGQVSSLNVSVATGVALFEVVRQRG